MAFHFCRFHLRCYLTSDTVTVHPQESNVQNSSPSLSLFKFTMTLSNVNLSLIMFAVSNFSNPLSSTSSASPSPAGSCTVNVNHCFKSICPPLICRRTFFVSRRFPSFSLRSQKKHFIEEDAVGLDKVHKHNGRDSDQQHDDSQLDVDVVIGRESG